ncbi:MAG TPA: glycosyltransferase [Solirubrobacteraceae bacterium]|nr:glycosyltransferase [Solirubrobacteraceae bacterium]
MARGERFSIAHVTPYAWEAQENALNAHVRELAAGLSRRGHRVLVLAPSRSRERVGATRRAVRAARVSGGGLGGLLQSAGEGEPLVLAVGEVLDVGGAASRNGAARRRTRALPIDVARTIEELLSGLTLDFVHVHEPFAPSAANAALRHSRALNVASFHEPSERMLLALMARRFVETFFGRLDARIATSERAAELMNRHFPSSYRVLEGAGERAVEGLEGVYRELAARRHERRGDPALERALTGRELIDVDLHMHTDHSYDCETPVEVLLASARERGLGAIAVTDHNEISGALAAAELAAEQAAGRDAVAPLKVIVGEEVKTASQGEVIGLFLSEKIPRGLSLAETIAEIRRQGGLVYVPHPFDRLHSVPDYEHLLGVLDEVDAIEVFNPRVAIASFNEEARRFAEKYRVIAGAGSDSHVAQGLGSVRIRMRDFEGPGEFLQSLRDAEIVTRPTSLIYVQALKFLQTRATPAAARRASRARRVKRALGGSRRARK